MPEVRQQAQLCRSFLQRSCVGALRDGGMPELEGVSMSEVKNCLTCRWEPEWEWDQRSTTSLNGGQVHYGRCQFPLPSVFHGQLGVWFYSKSGNCFPNLGGSIIENCPAHQSADVYL